VRTTRGNENPSSGQPHLSIAVRALLRRCLEAYRSTRTALAKSRASRPRNRADAPSPNPVEAEATTGSAGAPPSELVSITERSDALAAMCERLLNELDETEVAAAEIRFIVNRNRHSDEARMDPRSSADLPPGELALELRRLISWAAGTLGDVAGVLETRAVDLDETARELLQDELRALDVDLGAVNARLADPVDWDAELGRLVSGEVAPFDDPLLDEDDDNHG
jgi:hypothetical protein